MHHVLFNDSYSACWIRLVVDRTRNYAYNRLLQIVRWIHRPIDRPTDGQVTARSRLCQPFDTESLFFSASTILEERSSSLSVDSDKLSVPLAEEPCFTLCLPFLALCKKIERIFANCVLLRSLAISSLLARALFVCHPIHWKKNRHWRALSKQSRMLRCKESDCITHVYDHDWKLLQEQRDDRLRSAHSVEIARYLRCPRETRRNVRENLSKNAISNKCIRVKRQYEYSFIRSWYSLARKL